jgi:hypothetical protein
MKTPVGILLMCIGITSAAPAGSEGLSASRAVIAIMAGELFVGLAEGSLSGGGTLLIHSQRNPALTCHGQFTSNARTGGLGQLACSDGATANFQFERLSIFRGHGTGDYSLGPMSFCYGMTPEEAAPFLKLPEGKRLMRSGSELTLVDH